MKLSRKLMFASAATGLSLLAAFFVLELVRRYDLEEQASTLMTNTVTQILSSGESTLLLENADPLVPVSAPDLTTIAGYGSLVALDPPEGGAQVPGSLSATAPSAQFAITAHYGLGKVSTEALLTYRDGLWLFTHFALVPGELAE
jgi:hypothetical protein